MIDFKTVKLGKQAPKIDLRTLKFGNYIDVQALPKNPPTIDWARKVPYWPILLNAPDPRDPSALILGDCTVAGALHMEQCWSANAGGSFMPTNAEALASYETLGYKPGDPSTDQGANMLDVVKLWRSTGIGGNSIGAFASIRPVAHAHVTAAIWLLGGIYCGVELPITAQGQNVWELVETDSSDDDPGSWGGHCVPIFSYDINGAQSLVAVSWGELIPITWSFWDVYFSEAFAVFSDQWLAKTGDSPSGFNKTQLLSDVNAVAA